jgi:uncharacterized protein
MGAGSGAQAKQGQDCGFVKTDKGSKRRAESVSARLRIADWLRPVLFVLAWLLLAAGIVGLFLPLVPGTPFLILAAACFTRSSPRFETWLLDHPRFGPPVREWRARRAIPRKAKVFACLSLAVSWLIIAATGAGMAVNLVCLATFIAVAIYLTTRPEQ